MSSRNILKHTANTFSPTDPILGDEWYNTSNGRLYKYLAVNGTSPQWVELYSGVSSAGFTLPSWDNSTRPIGRLNLGFNKTNNRVEFYNNYQNTISYGSLQFDGTSQYLSTPTNAALNFGTGDFTVEAWVNTTAANAGDFFIISATGSGGFFFGYNSAADSYGWGRAAIAWDYNIGATKNNGVWQHIAVSRSGTSMRIFVNGVQVGTTQTNSTAYDLSLTSTVVGWQASTYYFPGYISNLRIVKGVAVYTANFTVPTQPLQATGNTSLLLLINTNDTKIIDSSPNPLTLTNNGGVTFSTFTPFSSLYITSFSSNWLNIQKRPTAFEYLIVGGGAGGGAGFSTNARGGGGGAGGVVYGNFQNYLTGSSTFTVIVGGGGAGLAANTAGVGGPGTNTSISGPTSTTTSLAALLTDRSTNAFTVTNNGGVSVVSTSTYGIYSGSLSFNGTTQYLTTPVATNGPLDLAAGAGDWTVECWVYATSLAGSASIFWKAAGENPTYALWLNLTVPQWIVSDGAAGVSSGGPPSIGLAQNLSEITTFTWYHFALVRSGSRITAYTNGVAATPQTLTFTMGNGSDGQLLYVGNANDGRFFPGYISNLRIVKGVAVYTTTTNIPIAPLAVTQPANGNINAISAGQTSLLLGVNNNYLSVIGAGGGGGSSWDVRLGGISGGSGGGGYTASPAISNISTSTQRSIYGYGLGNSGSTGSVYSAISGAGGGGGAGGAAISGLATGKGGNGGIGTNLYSSILESVSMGVRSTSGVFVSTVSNVTLFGPATGSLQFNGSSQYLSVSNNGGLNMDAGNFTIEAWIYLLATPASSGSGIVYKRATSAVFGGVGLGFTAAVLTPNLLATVNGTTWGVNITSSIAVAVREWAHVAATRSGNVFTLWVNGVSGGTVTVAGTIPTNTAALTVGAVSADGSFPFNGYITNVRIIKSIALYTSSFTRTVPLTRTTNTQLLLLVPGDLNKTFDSSTVTNTVTNVGATFSTFVPSTSTNVSVFSGAGNYYIGGGGGGGGSAVPGLGGIGGGGDGANITQNGYNGIVYTGGGGGGGGGASAAGGNGGSGGSGVVIIRHLDAYTTGTISTGSARVVVSGGYRNYVFTSSGVISF